MGLPYFFSRRNISLLSSVCFLNYINFFIDPYTVYYTIIIKVLLCYNQILFIVTDVFWTQLLSSVVEHKYTQCFSLYLLNFFSSVIKMTRQILVLLKTANQAVLESKMIFFSKQWRVVTRNKTFNRQQCNTARYYDGCYFCQ